MSWICVIKFWNIQKDDSVDIAIRSSSLNFGASSVSLARFPHVSGSETLEAMEEASSNSRTTLNILFAWLQGASNTELLVFDGGG